MYRLRQMELDDKVCEQVEAGLLKQVYPRQAIERCVGRSQPWASKVRRVRKSTLLTLVLFVIALALWSRLRQALVWEKVVSKLSALHPGDPRSELSASALAGRRQVLGSQGLAALLHECCHPLAQPESMPWAYFGRYRLLAIDGTLFATADTPANAAAFGRSSNQYGPGAYPQVRAHLLAECGSHAVIELELSRYDVSEVHGAHHLLEEVGPDTLVLVDAGITSGGFLERRRRLCDGSVFAWVPPSRCGQVLYPVQRGLWVRILSYRVTDERLGEVGQVYRLVTTLLNPRIAPAVELIALYHERWEIELVIDEIKTHERAQQKVLRSKTPEGVRQELYGLFLAHYAVRVHLAGAAVEAGLNPDRLSFTAGVFVLTELFDLALILAPEATELLLARMHKQMGRPRLPERHLRVNRREVKQIYCKYKPKKRQLPPPAPFEPQEQFLDFVELLDPLAAVATTGTGGT
jgi:Transposase DDE domain/Insertion element 4 transposase N-terminal